MAIDKPKGLTTVGPYSRLLSRGTVDLRSREGRYLRAVEAQLIEHIGGKPSAAQRLLIGRIARVSLQLALFDEKLAAGNWTDHDARTYGGLSSSFRLLLREIGLKSIAERGPSLRDYLAAKEAARTPSSPEAA